MKKKFKIEGMSCQHCVGRVKQAIEVYAGVSDVRVDLSAKEAVFNCNPDKIETDVIIKEIETLGFKAKEIS